MILRPGSTRKRGRAGTLAGGSIAALLCCMYAKRLYEHLFGLIDGGHAYGSRGLVVAVVAAVRMIIPR